MNSMNGSTGFRGPTGSNSGRNMGFGGDIVPKGYKMGQIEQFTPQQKDLFRRLFSMLSPESDLARLAGGDESFFEEMEAPSLRQFNELLGQLGSRFSGMGMGARRSSGFQNTATSAASNFAQELAAKRQDLQRQAVMDLMGLSEHLLAQRPTERFLAPKQQKDKSSGLGGLIGAGLGGLGGFFAGGPGGALAGASIGQRVGSAF